MRRVAAGVAMLAAVSATPARASVLEVSTSVAVEDADNEATVQTALQSAVDQALKDAPAFTPTVVTVTRAFVAGRRLYLRVLLSDEPDAPSTREPVTPATSLPPQPRADI